MIQVCESCGVVIGNDIEGMGTKAGFRSTGFDLCDDCLEKVEAFFLDELGVAKPLTIDNVDVPKTMGNMAVKERDKRAEKKLADSVIIAEED